MDGALCPIHLESRYKRSGGFMLKKILNKKNIILIFICLISLVLYKKFIDNKEPKTLPEVKSLVAEKKQIKSENNIENNNVNTGSNDDHQDDLYSQDRKQKRKLDNFFDSGQDRGFDHNSGQTGLNHDLFDSLNEDESIHDINKNLGVDSVEKQMDASLNNKEDKNIKDNYTANNVDNTNGINDQEKQETVKYIRDEIGKKYLELEQERAQNRMIETLNEKTKEALNNALFN